MGMSGEDKFEGENRNVEQMNYNSANLSSDWPFNGLNNLTNTSINPMDNTSCSSTSMVDSFWDHQATNSQNLGGFCDMNLQNNATTSSSSIGFRKNNLLVPLRNHDMFLLPAASTMLPQIPADLGFIERATRFLCYGGGNFGNMMNPFGDVPGPYSSRVNGLELGFDEGSKDVSMSVDSDGSQLKNERQSEAKLRDGGGDLGQKESSNEGFGSKKRRRSGQNTEYDQGKGTPRAPEEATKNDNKVQQKGENNSNAVTNKSSGKHGKSGSQASDTHKEEYIHVRARRGQATNSHSLAERVRREKISERMKFLQDLVPGCSKVTGKAVMLDEIINYVQSLQKQVEFLSMKLASVNPRMDFNIEALLSKDLLQSQVGPSGTLGFGPDMTMPYPPPLHPSQTGIMQAGLSGAGSSSDAARRTFHSHLTTTSGGYKNPSSQVPNSWNDELHNVVQMGLNPGTPLGSQDLGSTPPDHSKVES